MAKWKDRQTYYDSRKQRKSGGDANLPTTLQCYSYEHVTDIYGAMVQSATQESPDYQQYDTRRSIHDFRVWVFHIEVIKGTHLTNLVDRTVTGYFLGTTATRSVIRYWYPSRPSTVGYCTTPKFNAYETLDPSGELSPRSKITQDLSQDKEIELTKINDQDNPLMNNTIEKTKIKLP